METAFVAAIAVSLLLLAASWFGDGAFLGRRAGMDFAAFYNAGRILNSGAHAKLYDLGLQTSLFQQLYPAESGTELFPNLPWFALIFRPFALLPFRFAYLAWLICSVVLYLSGVRLLWPAALHRTALRHVALAALSFHPLIMESLPSGQVSAVAFFLFAASTRLMRSGWPLLAGCVLSACLYKPTMLLLPLFMLLICRRWRALAGVTLGAAGLACVSVLCVGRSSLSDYARTMALYSDLTGSPRDAFLAWEKLIDGYHFFRSLPGGDSAIMMAVACAAALFLLGVLTLVWGGTANAGEDVRDVGWGASITFTLVLNLHALHHDAVLLVAGALVCLEPLCRRPDLVLKAAYFRMALLLWTLPWISQTLTRVTGIQVYTLAIALFGLLQLATVRRLAAGDSASGTPTASVDGRFA
jgi:hypothetical protein